jgi:cell division protein FtsN
MNCAYSHQPSLARRQQGNMLIGIFIGLVIGVVAAAGVVWYLNKTPVPFQDGKGTHAEAAKNGDANGTNGTDKSNHGQTQSAPESLPAKAGDKRQEKRFTFYDILPGKQEAVPGANPAPPSSEKAPTLPPVAAVPSGEVLFLQVGAFQKPAEADSLKARLALIGVETSVQEVIIPDKGTMYRVRVGPYGQIEDMNKARSLLTQNGIAVSVVRAKDAAKP